MSTRPAPQLTVRADLGAGVTHYFLSVDKQLQGLSGSLQRQCLEMERDYWEWRYARFVCKAADPEPWPVKHPDASDFLLVICGLSARLSRLRPAKASGGPNGE